MVERRSEIYFCPGGTLPGDVPSYVKREADTALLNALLAGEFCYVLDTRQVGKSSLMVRTAQRLQAGGQCTAILDISSIGDNLTQEQWYFGLLTNLAVACDLEMEAEEYWIQHSHLGSVQRWFMTVRNVFLSRLDAPFVVFVDEIDAVRKLPFSVDEFFAAIRECHNRRASDTEAQQLTFCLIGVATPSDLIQDVRTTPFNIGRRIELHDFSLNEMQTLAAGLSGNRMQRQQQIRRIWRWTAGHPYLTQKFCQAVARAERPLTSGEIDSLCRRIFLCREAQEEEDNLKFVSRHLLVEEASRADILTLYNKIRTGRHFHVGDNPDLLVQRLLLSGLIYMTMAGLHRRMAIRNRIYATVFDHRWVRANMPGAEVRRQQAALRRGFTRGTLVWACIAGLAALTLYQTDRASVESGRAQKAVFKQRQLSQQIEVGTHALDDLNRRILSQEHRSAQQQKKQQRATDQAHRELDRTRKDLGNTARKLDGQKQAGMQMSANLANEQRILGGLRYENERVINDIISVANPISMAGRGNELEAVRFGLNSLAPARSRHALPSRPTMQFLVDAVCAGVVRRLRLIHPGGVADAALSPDNKRMVTVGEGRNAYIWDVQTGALVQRLAVIPITSVHPIINSVSYSADGRWILTAGNDNRVRLWEARNPTEIQTTPLLDLKLGDVYFATAALSDDASRLVTTAPGDAVKLWKLSMPANKSSLDCHLLYTLRSPFGASSDHVQYMWAVDISHNGNLVAAGGSDKALCVWDANTGRSISTTEHAHEETIRSVRFNAWNNHLISTGEDHSAHLWALTPGIVVRNHYPGHPDTIWDAEIAGSDLYVATAGQDRSVRIWSFNPSLAPLYVLSTHTNTVWTARFSHDVQCVVTASADHTAELWEFTVPTFSASNGYTRCVAFSPDGQHVVCCRKDGLASVWGWRDNDHEWHFYTSGTAQPRECRYAAFSHDGHWVATASADGSVLLWKIADYAKWEFYHNPTRTLQRLTGSPVYTVTYSPDDRWILTASADGTAVLWDSHTGERKRIFRAPRGEVLSAFFSPNGQQIITTNQDGSVSLWDLTGTQPLRVLLPPGRQQRTGNGHHAMSAVFSPDGRYVLSADNDHRAYLWEAQTGKYVGALEGHGGVVNAAVFSPDGKWIATGSADRTVCLWAVSDLFIGKKPTPLYAIHNHADGVECVAFSADGKWLATASLDGTCRVYPGTFDGMVARAHELAKMQYVERRVDETEHTGKAAVLTPDAWIRGQGSLPYSKAPHAVKQ